MHQGPFNKGFHPEGTVWHIRTTYASCWCECTWRSLPRNQQKRSREYILKIVYGGLWKSPNICKIPHPYVYEKTVFYFTSVCCVPTASRCKLFFAWSTFNLRTVCDIVSETRGWWCTLLKGTFGCYFLLYNFFFCTVCHSWSLQHITNLKCENQHPCVAGHPHPDSPPEVLVYNHPGWYPH